MAKASEVHEVPEELSFEQGDCPYIVEITTVDGVPLFKGTVSQKGDFIHLNRHLHSSVATLRVHDMAAASKKQEPVKLVEPVMVDPPADQSWLKMENA